MRKEGQVHRMNRKIICCSLSDFHMIDVNVYGPEINGNRFHVLSRRMSPAKVGSVTSSATQDTFFNSIIRKWFHSLVSS